MSHVITKLLKSGFSSPQCTSENTKSNYGLQNSHKPDAFKTGFLCREEGVGGGGVSLVPSTLPYL